MRTVAQMLNVVFVCVSESPCCDRGANAFVFREYVVEITSLWRGVGGSDKKRQPCYDQVAVIKRKGKKKKTLL